MLSGTDLRATVTTDADGNLPLTNLGLANGGVYCVVADYNGDGEYTPGLDAYTVVWVNVTGGDAYQIPPTATNLVSSLNPAHYTESITFTATVTFIEPEEDPPFGEVAFFAGSNLLGVSTLVDGVATWTTTELLTGSYPIAAWYLGNGSSGTLTQTINPNNTDLTLTRSSSSTLHYDLVTFTATVSPSGTPVTTTPTGRVDFYAGSDFIGSADVDDDGVATFLITWLDRGALAINAVYTGDSVFEESNESITHEVLNNFPDLASDAITTTEDSPVTINALANDFDADEDALTITGVRPPAHGTATVTSNRVIYTPEAGFVGTVDLTYSVSDGFVETEGHIIVQVLATGTGNRVFADTDGNGVQDPSERGVPLVLVEVFDTLGVVVGSVLTDGNGYYFLPPDLLAGDYSLRFTLLPGFEQVPFTAQDVGIDDTVDSDVSANGETAVFTCDPASGWPDLDAGVILDPTDPAFAYLFDE